MDQYSIYEPSFYNLVVKYLKYTSFQSTENYFIVAATGGILLATARMLSRETKSARWKVGMTNGLRKIEPNTPRKTSPAEVASA